jgi:hypothetical protein
MPGDTTVKSTFTRMLLWCVIAPEFGIANISYVKAMLITIAIWLVVAPVLAIARSKYHFHYKT